MLPLFGCLSSRSALASAAAIDQPEAEQRSNFSQLTEGSAEFGVEEIENKKQIEPVLQVQFSFQDEEDNFFCVCVLKFLSDHFSRMAAK